jgi:1-acyl-sn-glycerol-3-phosphate acyltransferase
VGYLDVRDPHPEASQVIRRRLVTIPSVILALAIVSAALPLLVLVSLLVDLVAPHPGPLPASQGEGGSFSTTRLLAFSWCFLAIENLGLLLLFWTWLTTPAGTRQRAERTFVIQRRYSGWLLRAVTRIFSLKFVVHGAELVAPGPVLVFVRHASLVDVLIPGGFIANTHLIELRYVLKKELLSEPCLDVAGHWIPNHFVDRHSADPATELAALRALKHGIGPREGVIIYPEGTRFSLRKREAALAKLAGPARERAQKLRHLLPIRPGGAMSLLAAEPKCDVLFVGHHGLEGLTKLGDIWRGSLVGKTITLRFWREPAASVPGDDETRLQWVNEHWQLIDDWLETFQ